MAGRGYSGRVDEALIEVVRQFGIEPVAMRRFPAGRQNEHWRVGTVQGQLVLRRYSAARREGAIATEHAALRHLAGLEWPVAAAIAAPVGTVVVAEGRRYGLFPLLGGKPAAGNRRMGRIKGRLLARLHRDFAGFPMEGQREGFGRAWELDLAGQTDEFPSFNALLAAFEGEHGELARAVRGQRYRNLRELSRLGYGELTGQPVHGDFHHDNLLFEGAELTGLLDLDSMRLDARVADLAASLALDCREAPEHDAIDVKQAEAFAAGYLEGARLEDGELAMVPALVRAQWLWLVNLRLRQWAEGSTTGWGNLSVEGDGRERALASIARSVERRFPALEARSGALVEALQRAAEQAAAEAPSR